MRLIRLSAVFFFTFGSNLPITCLMLIAAALVLLGEVVG